MMIDNFQIPHIMSNSEGVKVTADITVKQGALTPTLYSTNYKTNLYLSKDKVLNKDEDLLWTALNTEGVFLIKVATSLIKIALSIKELEFLSSF